MKPKHAVIMTLLLALVCVPAMATNGYFTHGQGTANKSMGGAGVALPLEALNSALNPAAAAFVKSGYSASLALFSPERQYTVSGNPSGYPQTFGLQPGTVQSESNYFPMPALGFNFRPTERDAANFTLVAHGGMNTDYHTNTFYGSDQTGVDLSQAFVSGTWAHKVTERQGLGISGIIAYQRFKATGLQAFSAMSSSPAELTNNGYDDSYGFGVKLGYIGYIRPELSFGASYSPTIRMSKFEHYSGLFADGGSFNIPATMSAGFAYQPTRPLTLALDVERIHYSDVRSVGQHFLPALMATPLGTEEAAGFGWNDVNVYKLGGQWETAGNWTWRAGYSKCDQPIPTTEVLFNILAPGVIEQHVTAGFSMPLRKAGGRFNFGAMYAPTQTVTGANPLEAPGQQQIELKMSEYELEFSYSFGF